MAKDDYHVLVYKILTYLYKRLKISAPIETEKLSYEALGIEEPYWTYIFSHMLDEGLVEGVFVRNVLGRENPVIAFGRLQITPKGIEYLEDNSAMARVRRAIKDIGELIPWH